MRFEFPYDDVAPVDVPESNLCGVFATPAAAEEMDPAALTAAAVAEPIGTPALRDLAADKKRVLIVSDDVSRPTPVHALLPPILAALHDAGITDDSIEFMMALGTHRPMRTDEMEQKLGPDIVAQFTVRNHDWDNPDACTMIGETAQGVKVWINRKVAEADLVIGIGRIMPIDICGFTGGGKILVPGVCGKTTNDDMHWTRIDLNDSDIIGKRDNAVRESIDELARKAGLDFIVNVVMDSHQHVTQVVAGDLTEAHRKGCELAVEMHGVRIPEKADIVIADSYPFDIEFWQANKALDQAGLVVKEGGVLILVTPCTEGFSATHSEILEFGYPPIDEIKDLVKQGRIPSKVVGVHMAQVSHVARHKAHVILVTSGIPRRDVEEAGLGYAETPQAALEEAFARAGSDAGVIVLKGAAEMLPVVG